MSERTRVDSPTFGGQATSKGTGSASQPAPRTGPVVAINRGVVALVADSDGRLVDHPRHLERSPRRLARAQRAVSRKKKRPRRREKAKGRVARLHRKVRPQRASVTHALRAGCAKSHGTAVGEKLPTGNRVPSNRGLARSILDAGWGQRVS